MNTQKLAEIFSEKFHMMATELWREMRHLAFEEKFDEIWTEYLNGIDCTVITRDDIRDDFEGVIHSAQGKVCVAVNPKIPSLSERTVYILDRRTPYILVPVELADKALILGGLPERWFPETSKT